MESYVKAIKPWLGLNEIEIRSGRTKGSTDKPTHRNERTPIQGELKKKMLLAGAPRTKGRMRAYRPLRFEAGGVGRLSW
jgi:hypothetical protein